MNDEIRAMTQWVVPAALVVAGLVLGLALEWLVLGRMVRAIGRTGWRVGTLLLESSRGLVLGVCLLVAISTATLFVELGSRLSRLAEPGLEIAVIALVTVFAARFLAGLVGAYARRIEGLSLVGHVTKLLVYLVGVLVVLQSFGVSITPILTALGVGGLAVALALQDTLSNLFAGLHIIATKQVKPGDYVRLESGEEGYVVDITWRNTSVRRILDYVTIIPNSKLASTIVTNYYRPATEMGFLVQVGVDYRSDLGHVERVTIEVAREVMREVPGGVPHFEPFIRYHTFADFRVSFAVILRVKEFVDHYVVKHEFVKRLHARYAKEGIAIALPATTVHLQDGDPVGPGRRPGVPAR